MRFLHTVKHFWIVSYRIVSYRDILCDIVSYRIVSFMAVSCHHYQVDHTFVFAASVVATQVTCKTVILRLKDSLRLFAVW